MKKLYLFVLVFVVSLAGFSQDAHNSQFYSAPMHLNPAMTGVFRGNYRFTTLYRSQWASVLKDENISNFRTIWGGIDFRLPLNKGGWNKHNALGVGINAMNDKAADSRFGTTQVGLAVSYHQSLGRNGKQFLIVGLQGNFYQQTLSPTDLRLGHQWNGIAYDQSILQSDDPSIAFINTNLIYFDAGAGLLWFMQGQKERMNAYAGFAAHHVNQPTIDIVNNGIDEPAKLNMKMVVHGGVRLPIARQFDLMPKALFMFQGDNLEMVVGSDIRYNFDYYDLNSSSFRFGLLYRAVGGLTKDSNDQTGFGTEALVALAGFDYKGLNIGFAYDINLSEFRTGTQARGGFEVSLAYTGKFKQRYNPKTPCPDF